MRHHVGAKKNKIWVPCKSNKQSTPLSCLSSPKLQTFNGQDDIFYNTQFTIIAYGVCMCVRMCVCTPVEASSQHQESSSPAVYLTLYACTSRGHVHGTEAKGQPSGVTSLFPPFHKTDAGYDACTVEACTESMNLPPYFLRQGLSLGPVFLLDWQLGR